jgi:hypothetical protein
VAFRSWAGAVAVVSVACGDHRGHDIHPSCLPEKQGDSAENRMLAKNLRWALSDLPSAPTTAAGGI